MIFAKSHSVICLNTRRLFSICIDRKRKIKSLVCSLAVNVSGTIFFSWSVKWMLQQPRMFFYENAMVVEVLYLKSLVSATCEGSPISEARCVILLITSPAAAGTMVVQPRASEQIQIDPPDNTFPLFHTVSQLWSPFVVRSPLPPLTSEGYLPMLTSSRISICPS